MKEILAEIKRYLIFQKNYYGQELKEFKNKSLKEKWEYIKLQRKIKKILETDEERKKKKFYLLLISLIMLLTSMAFAIKLL